MSSFNDFLEMFNNNDLNVEKYFGSFSVWFDMLKKRGLMSEVDPLNAAGSEEWQNEYLLWLYENDRPNYQKWISHILDDVVYEEGNAYWLGEKGRLSELFCTSGRDDLSHEFIASVLDGNMDYDRYWSTSDNIYRDVIDELTKENIELLKIKIVKSLEGIEISPETEEMELLAAEQGHDDFLVINDENVTRIIDDEDSMDVLLRDELEELKIDLSSLFDSAYNTAYEDEIYKEIEEELDEYFNMSKGEWVSTPHPYKKETTIYKYKVPIYDLEGFINDYLSENKKYGISGNLAYHGSLLGLLGEDKPCLRPRIPDYPDSRKIDKYINEMFSEYI